MTSDRANLLRRWHAGLTGSDPGAHTALGQRRRGLTDDRFTREMRAAERSVMLGEGNWIVEWHNPRENVDGKMRAEDESKAERLVSQLQSLGNTNVHYHAEEA